MKARWIAWFLLATPALGCDVILGIDSGISRCEGLAEGEALPEQALGDCKVEVCDAAGKTQFVPDAEDVPDDNNPCTVDSCDGTEPVFEPVLSGSVRCYEGPDETEGVGPCKAGEQFCQDGQLAGECAGQVLPQAESCLTDGDEDCDGQSNEEGEGCICLPGSQEPCYPGSPETQGVGACTAGIHICEPSGAAFGSCEGAVTPVEEHCDAQAIDEDCDGAINEGGANCFCGDGFFSPEAEACDDDNNSNDDACTTLCLEQRVVEITTGNLYGCVRLSNKNVKCWGAEYSGSLGAATGNTLYNEGDAPGEMGVNLPAVVLGGNPQAKAIANWSHTCVVWESGFLKCWGSNESGQLGLNDTVARGGTVGSMGDNLPAVNLGNGKFVKAVATGETHTCAVLTDDTLRCWGKGHLGQTGLDTDLDIGDQPGEVDQDLPAIELGPNAKVTAVTAGFGHTCALLSDGTVKCWGWGLYGQHGLGNGNTVGDNGGEMANLPPVNLGSGKVAVAIDAGSFHTCALLSDGKVKCWGNNGSGRLGYGDLQSRGTKPEDMGDMLPTVDLGVGKLAKAISVGNAHSCALLTDGSVKCWGLNDKGQLGQGDVEYRGDEPGEMGDMLAPIDLGTGKSAVAISAGLAYTCAVLNDGSVKCWGDNSNGQLGHGHTYTIGDQAGEMGDNLPISPFWTTAW